MLTKLLFLALATNLFCLDSHAQPPSKVSVMGVGKKDFVVDRSVLLSPKNQWIPGGEPFPIDLQAFTEKAKTHLFAKTKPKKAIKLLNVGVHAYRIRNLVSRPETDESERRCAWYLVFTFDPLKLEVPRPEREDYTVVMLFDGTIAEEALQSEQ